ncbi:MAG TPA: hypothetical protein VF116_04160 [Ktedonobacterales bacterium]
MPARVRLHPIARLIAIRSTWQGDDDEDESARSRVLARFARLWPALRTLWLLAVPTVVALAAVLDLRGELPRATVAIVPATIACAVLVLLSWYAALARAALRIRHRRRLAAVYGLMRVRRIRGEPFVPRYAPGIYLPRHDATTGDDADFRACEAMRAAAHRSPRSPLAPLGVCIYGRSGQGKTRLAWEVVRALFPGWTLLRWPHDPARELDPRALRGEHVVLWLDNLHEFATPSIGATLGDLPRRFAALGIPLVVAATCHDGRDQARTRAHLASLLDRLAAVRPADFTPTEADQLAAGLEKAGQPAYRDEFSGTPGSVVLGPRRMRREVFPTLGEPARLVLDTLTLLRSARIYAYPAWRVRVTAMDLFDLPPAAWNAARDELARAGFLRSATSADAPLAAVSDLFLDASVPDYLQRNAEPSDDWPYLFESLERHRDLYALSALGNALSELFRGIDLFMASSPRHEKELGVLCFRAAIEVCNEAEQPREWAMAQMDLGRALAGRAEVADRLLRVDFRRQALAAYRLAAAVLTSKAAPAHWALAQLRLAAIAQNRGADALYGGDVQTACTQLTEAHRYASAALAFYTSETDPTGHGEARALLAEVEEALRALDCLPG